MSRGLSPALVPRLEALSGYRQQAGAAPSPALSFWRLDTAQGSVCVLARVAAAPPDHTNRSNKIASFLVLDGDELCGAGPAWLLAHAPWRTAWAGAPAWIEGPTALPAAADPGPEQCAHWERACGDAGWAGVLASAFLRDMSRPAHIVYAPDTDPLALAREAASLLPPWARWRATFSTLFLQPVAGAPCAWRFCLAGTAAADDARGAKTLVLDLTRPMGRAPESRHVRAARTGVLEPADGRGHESDGAPGDTRDAGGTPDVSRRTGAGGAAGEALPARGEPPPYELEPAHDSTHGREARVPTWARRGAPAPGGSRTEARAPAGASPDAPVERTPRVSAALFAVLAALASVAVVIGMVWWVAGRQTGSGGASHGADGGGGILAPGVGAGPTDRADGEARESSADGAAHPPVASSEGAEELPPDSAATHGEPGPPTAPPTAPPDAPGSSAKAGPEPAPAQPDAPAPPREPDPLAAPSTDSATEVAAIAPHVEGLPWVELKRRRDDGTLGLRGILPPELGVTSARFVVPAFLRAAGLEGQEDFLHFPARSGRAEARVQGDTLEVVVPEIWQSVEALAPVVALPTSAEPGAFGLAVLRRIPLELLDAGGAVVGRARVEAPLRILATEPGKAVAYASAIREPSLRLTVYQLNGRARTLLATRTCVPGDVLTLPGGRGGVVIGTTSRANLSVTATAAPLNLEQVRANLAAEARQLQDLARAVQTLEKRMANINRSDTEVAKALALLESSLTEEERRLVAGSGKVQRSITDPAALRDLLPVLQRRVKSETERVQKEISRASQRPPGTVAVEVASADGFLLATMYPEGPPE
jgi:hypothetical protein